MASAQELLPVIRQVIQEEISPKLDKLEQKINEIAILHKSVDECETRLNEQEKSITYNGNQLKDLLDVTIPTLEKNFKELCQTICTKILDVDVHRHKWSLVISGLKGEANETEGDTQIKLKKFAVDHLKVKDANKHLMAACHRLSQDADANIIAKFVNLNDRNEWLASGKHLKDKNLKISISPDLPPVLRPLKKDILQQRKSLQVEDRKLSKVKYLPRWPYVSLAVRGQASIIPTLKKETIITNYLALKL